MPVVKLRCSEQLLRTVLCLDQINAEIVGVTMASPGGYPIVELDIDAPSAPDGTTQMDPVLHKDYDSGRVTLLDPGWHSD